MLAVLAAMPMMLMQANAFDANAVMAAVVIAMEALVK